MSKEDLIHLKEKGDPYSDGIRAKLVGTASEKRKQSAILRGLKMANPQTIEKRALELVASPNTSAVEIMRYATILMQREDLSDILKVSLLGQLTRCHTAIHGNKIDLKADIDTQVRNITETTEVQAKKEFLLRVKLLDLVSEKIKEKFGYEMMIEVQRIIYQSLKEVESSPIQQLEELQAINIIKIRKFLPQCSYDWNKASDLAKKEMEQEVEIE